MKKNWIAKSAALLACVMMTGSHGAIAEEKRLGDYIYVPAMQVSPINGSIELRVQGRMLGRESDEAVVVDALAGAEFGVYVFSGSGELTPWANPLYPSEPMRIRTGEGETRFSLPQGAEYYLRQESAPHGYVFDDETLIPVTGETIVVENVMPGQLVVSAVDSLGVPVVGAQVMITGEDGLTQTLETDARGEIVIQSAHAQDFLIAEGMLPEGVFAARSVQGGEVTEQGVYAQVSPASRTRVTFEHPASGSVLLDMKMVTLDDNAQPAEHPLSGVRLEIDSQPPVSVLTDENGQARAQLLEGTYHVRFGYEGDEAVTLPVSEGQMVVQSGSTTVIELSAVETTGRVVLFGESEKPVSGASVLLRSATSGERFGPYALDAEGIAVSQPLEAGEYRIEHFTADGGVTLGGIACGEERAQAADGLAIVVQPGQATQVKLALLTRESQVFVLVKEEIGELGDCVQTPLGEAASLVLLDEFGDEAAQFDSQQGSVTVEALNGRYTLKMEQEDAQKLGVQPVSAEFELPSAQETIAFVSENTRLILRSVDDNGMPVPHALYQLTDSTGTRFEVACDEDGMAVTPLLSVGEVIIETLDAPKNHDAAKMLTVAASSGYAEHVQIVHERHGTAAISVALQTLGEGGASMHMPLTGRTVRMYHAAQDQSLIDIGIALTTDDAGMAYVQLPEGEYAAVLDEQALDEDMRVPMAVRFAMHDMQQTDVQLICLDMQGGVRVNMTGGDVTDDMLAQIRFELESVSGDRIALVMRDGGFYAGGLDEGEYVLHQTQSPQGYSLAAMQRVLVTGGVVAEAAVPLEEYAVLSVSKTGLTFDQKLRTYVVPLSGEYGVFTREDGEMKPYPSQENQATLWANVTAQEIAAGKLQRVKLPASMTGTTYYLHELTAAPGFAVDETYYEVVLTAGEQRTLACAVSSDRGFFSLDTLDASSGAHVPGGVFALEDRLTGETVLTFEMGEDAYQNAMAVPVGQYVLRQLAAADGYALSSPAQMDVTVEPYLTEGGTITAVQMTAARIPNSRELTLLDDMYAAREQGLMLLSVDAGALETGEALSAASLMIEVGAVGSERSDIASVVIAGTGDQFGGSYRARVEYCLDGGGWQPSDARLTDVLAGPAAVSLDDVRDDIRAVRVTYLDAQTGEERVQGGFTPGHVTLSIEASAQDEVDMQAKAVFGGQFVYQTQPGDAVSSVERVSEKLLAFTMQTDGLFETVSAGRDGKISGVAFFDEDADGVMDASETGRYAGLTVSLVSASGEVVDTMRTGADGRYAFSAISGGEYQVRFDAGESVVFSEGGLYSCHAISGVQDMREGTSGGLTIDGDHTDYVVNVGCIFAAEVVGAVIEHAPDGETIGFSGLTIEMREVNAGKDDEPLLVVSGGMGEFEFRRLLPGDYEVAIDIPQGYLCRESEDGRVTRTIELLAGDTVSLGALLLEKAASVQGSVRVDDDGDGIIGEQAQAVEGIVVKLLGVDGAHTDVIAETITDESGMYAFDLLYPGQYSVLFELGGEWAFTRYGDDSGVYGAAAQSGTTQAFVLEPGEVRVDENAGVTIPAALYVMAFADTQYDGLKGVYEEGLSDVHISLIRLENGEDAEEITAQTNAQGEVRFEGVSPGEYVLAYQMPGQWRATKQAESANYPVSCVPQSVLSAGRSEPFVLAMGETDAELYIGAMLSCSISGIVYYDDDADAKRDENEAPCEQTMIELLDREGNTVAQTQPDASGRYAFDGLAPGRYSVRFTAQQDCGFSGTERTATRGGVLESESNVSSTRSITVTAGQSAANADAGVVRLSAIGGVIWEDQNADRSQNENERNMSGLIVHLMDGAGRNILRSTTTDDRGAYVFDGLKPGTYKIRMDAPEGYVFSGAPVDAPLQLETERDGRGYTYAFALLGGVRVENVSVGLLTQGVISGFVWEDTNFNGRFETEESGLRGATVTLLDETGAELARRQTIRSGEFTFDQLMPGNYAIRIALADGMTFTAEGGDSLAPCNYMASAEIPLGALNMGGTIGDVRIGALRMASVGGVVWYDQDDDGRRAVSESGRPGVRVTLEMLDGADAGRKLECATDENGVYRFENVTPGAAALRFELEEGYAFAGNASGAKRVSCVPMTNALSASTDTLIFRAGENRDDLDVGVVGVGTVSGMIWEDSAYNGHRDQTENGVPDAAVELVNAESGEIAAAVQTDENGAYEIPFVRKGEYKLRVTLPDGRIFTRSGDSLIADTDAETAETASFALIMGESRAQMDMGAIAPACVRGAVLIDSDEDGQVVSGDSGLRGVVVTVMQGGTVIATADTDENGGFSFDLLRPGVYRLRYTLDEEALFGEGTFLRLTNPDAQEGETGEMTLSMGQTQEVLPVCAVLSARIGGRAFVDADVNGAMNEGEAAMPGVLAELLNESGTRIASAMTDSDGHYVFDRLRSGKYSVRFTLESGMLFTDYTGIEGDSCVPVLAGNVSMTSVVSLKMGEEKTTMHVGGILPGRIGDTVWHDKDGNGLQDYKEPLLSGVPLTLLRMHADGTMTEAAHLESDRYGYYAFDALRPGRYVLRLDARDGDTLTSVFGEPLGEIDSDLDPDSCMSAPIELRSGQTLRNIDVGLIDCAD